MPNATNDTPPPPWPRGAAAGASGGAGLCTLAPAGAAGLKASRSCASGRTHSSAVGRNRGFVWPATNALMKSDRNSSPTSISGDPPNGGALVAHRRRPLFAGSPRPELRLKRAKVTRLRKGMPAGEKQLIDEHGHAKQVMLLGCAVSLPNLGPSSSGGV